MLVCKNPLEPESHEGLFFFLMTEPEKYRWHHNIAHFKFLDKKFCQDGVLL